MTSPSNAEVVRFLFDHSALLKVSGDSSFRVRAFANAARMIDELEVDVAETLGVSVKTLQKLEKRMLEAAA